MWFTLWSQPVESLRIDFPMFTPPAGGKDCWVINWKPINLICQTKTTLRTIPITQLAHVTKPKQVVHYLVQDSIIFIDSHYYWLLLKRNDDYGF